MSNDDKEVVANKISDNPTSDPSQTSEDKDKMVTSAMRTFFVVFALSFHAVMDGLALSLLEDVGDVWISFGAISLHKGGLIHNWYP